MRHRHACLLVLSSSLALASACGGDDAGNGTADTATTATDTAVATDTATAATDTAVASDSQAPTDTQTVTDTATATDAAPETVEDIAADDADVALPACDEGFHRVGASACMPDACDLVLQDCGDPGFKCTWIITNPSDPASPSESECEPVGQQALETSCTRTPATGTAGVGHDDCAAGLFCSGVGLALGPPPTRQCRKFCAHTSECPEGQACGDIDGDGPLAGFCLPTCQLVSDSGCSAEWTCTQFIDSDAATSTQCRLIGAGAVDDACTTANDCGKGMACAGIDPDYQCVPMCIGQNTACGDGGTCTAVTWLSGDLGVCVAGTVCPPPPTPPAECPAACTGDCIAGVCVIDCNDQKCTNGNLPPNGATVTCPDNMDCHVNCTGGGCVATNIVCPPTNGTCEIKCESGYACQDASVTCGAGACSTTSCAPGDGITPAGFLSWDCADSCGCSPGCPVGGP